MIRTPALTVLPKRGRVCHAIEIAPAYVDVAVKRWQEFTRQQAALDGDGRSFDSVAAQRAR